MVLVIISGTPGTGKSIIMERVCHHLGENAICLSANKIALENELDIAYDFSRDTFIVDEKALEKRVKEIIRGRPLALVESIDPCFLAEISDFIVVTKCTDISVLEERLRRKGWNVEKINENLEAEILSIVESQAYTCKEKDKVLVVDTCIEAQEDLVRRILELLERKDKSSRTSKTSHRES